MNAIEIKNLYKTFKVKDKAHGLKSGIKSIFKPNFKTIYAVNDISLSVKKGELLGFIGPNGAGKSTIIKTMMGILYPDSGSVKILGVSPTLQRRKLAYKIGAILGQKDQLWSNLTPFDNFKFLAHIYNINSNLIEKRIKELTDVFELKEIINLPVKGLSTGQKIRCELAASIIHNPEVLFLDEPSIGLDLVTKDNVRNLIKKMNQEYGTTVFLTSHDIGDIEKVCKRIVIIDKGKLVVDDLMDNLKNGYLNKRILEIHSKQKINLKSLENINILENSSSLTKLQLSTPYMVKDIVKDLDFDKVVDINILNVSLEEIITTIYKGSKKDEKIL